jgi:hypothetical protein
MKNIHQQTFSLLLALFLIVNLCHAQDNTGSKVFHIETKDGNGYTGVVVASDSTKVIFKADKLGELTILRNEIKSLEPVDAAKLKNGKYWFENPQATRYLFSPNGYGLKKGEGYYQNVWVLFNSFAVGITDYISVGGGVVPAFLFAGSPTPVWMTAKVSVPVVKDKFNLGAGVLAGTVLGESNTGFGIFYGIATVGSKDVNASLGLGYGFAGGSLSNAPMINLNGMCRISPRGYLITENYLFSDAYSTTAVLSFGGRTIIKNAGLDYGLVLPVSADTGIFAIPWLGLTIPFGKKKQ